MARTLDQLRLMLRRRLGWPAADTFVSDDELAGMLQESQDELFDLLVSIHGGDFHLSTGTFSTVAGQSFYIISPDISADFQADFRRLRRVSAVINNISIPMRRWNVETDVNDYNQVAWDESTDIRYRFTQVIPSQNGAGGQFLYVSPTPSNVVTVELWYNYGVGTFSTTDAINLLGNDEYLILDGMVKCQQMEETDPSATLAQKEHLIQMITSNQTPIDAGQPYTIQDVRSLDPFDMPSRRWR